jgi:hypothetical protein
MHWTRILAVACLVTVVSTTTQAKPLKVFILAGQSNMQGHAQVRTFEGIALDPKVAPMLKDMTNPDGTPVVCDDVWIASIGSSSQEKTGKLTAGFGAERRGPKIGPEFTFGIYMHQRLGEPILIIKTAWGGKSLHTDFRPPSAGAYPFTEAQLAAMKSRGKDIDAAKAEKAQATGHYYRLMIEYVKRVLADVKRVVPDYDARQGYELAGFVWFQGWNDMVDRGVYPHRDKPGGYDEYSRLLGLFIEDVRKDLGAPKLPFVIGVMGVGGPGKLGPDGKPEPSIGLNFRNAMAAPASMPQFKGTVRAVWTDQYWDQQVAELDARYGRKIKSKGRQWDQAVKDKKMTRQQVAEAREKLMAEVFTPKEREIRDKNISNFGFHYMGSGKIMAQIGRGFAEAMAELVKAADRD